MPQFRSFTPVVSLTELKVQIPNFPYGKLNAIGWFWDFGVLVVFHWIGVGLWSWEFGTLEDETLEI